MHNPWTEYFRPAIKGEGSCIAFVLSVLALVIGQHNDEYAYRIPHPYQT